jgi:hypothetical protein
MYTKKWLFYLLLMGLTAKAEAQITMTLQVPPSGVLLKNQLWNMVLVNTNLNSTIITVNLVLLDETTSQPVLTASSAPVTLSRGARQLQAKDLGPITYTYNAPALQADQDPNGFLPVGSYQACYTVESSTTGTVRKTENCIQLHVDPLSPPLLNTPSDEGSIYTSYPQFTWLPPTPAKLFNDLSYTLIVVEVLPGQGKADAIQQNIPVYSAGFVRNLYQNFPTSYKSLDTGKLYAWRIVATNNGQAAAMSDVWTFRVVKPGKPGTRRDDDVFVDLKRGLDPSYAAGTGSLKFTYENVPGDSTVSYTIRSLDDPGNPVVQQGTLTLRNGRNFLALDLDKKTYAEKKLYLFRIINGRNEEWTVKFTWTPANKKK